MARGIRRGVALGAVCGAALAVAAVAAVDAADQPAAAQTSAFTVSPEQLQINQRISQAAVRRSNEGLNLLKPVRPANSTDRNPINPFTSVSRGAGWPSAAIGGKAVTAAKLGDAAVTTAKLADDAVTNDKLQHPVYTAVVTGGGNLSRGTATQVTRTDDPGRYQVTFPVDVSACTYVAAQGGTSTALDGGNIGFAAAAQVAGTPTAVQVFTWAQDGSRANREFHLTVTC